MNVLLTAFAPASEESESQSWSWIKGASTPEDADRYVATLRLPPIWDGCFEILETALRQPWDAVVCVAARPTKSIMIERLALNECDVSRKDSLGRRPRERIIDPEGEAGYWTGLPYRDLTIRLAEAGLVSIASHSAGGQLGNYLFYKLMRWIDRTGSKIVGGLIHVPERFGMSLMAADANRVFLDCLLESIEQTTLRGDGLAVDLDRLDRLKVSREP